MLLLTNRLRWVSSPVSDLYLLLRSCLIVKLVRICLQCRKPQFDSWVGKICWIRDRLPTPIFLGFPCGSAGKESACNVEDLGSVPGLGRSPGEGKGYSLQYSDLENSVNYSPWGRKESDTTEWLSQCWLLTLCKFHMYNIIFLLVCIL